MATIDSEVTWEGLTREYLKRMQSANTEAARKELFLQLVTRLFADDNHAQGLLAELAKGAERTIVPKAGYGVGTVGRADTYSENVIIEWKAALRDGGSSRAREQLLKYVRNAWNPSDHYNLNLVATDGVTWKIFAPEWTLDDKNPQQGAPHALAERRIFRLDESNVNEFPFFIDEILFARPNRHPSLQSIRTDFGVGSPIFINSIRALRKCAALVEATSEFDVAFDQWRRLLSVAYGRYDDSVGLFYIHTYLSVLSKLIAHRVLEPTFSPSTGAIREILGGSAFEKHNITNFAEGDFFGWVTADPWFSALTESLLALSAKIAEYSFDRVDEDLLKGVYQDLIDLETKHALGEYYTPDWLCERIVQELELREGDRVLDPACGSGSFLRAIISKMRSRFPEMTAAQIVGQVNGIDIHPLSVQIAKTTILASLGPLVRESQSPIKLHVYLANSLLVPDGAADMIGHHVKITVDNRSHELDVASISSSDHFDKLVAFCDEIVTHYDHQLDYQSFQQIFAKRRLEPTNSPHFVSTLHPLYESMYRAKSDGRDSIWRFIIQNSYKPVFLKGYFDHIVGNPPWLTYSDIDNSEYQRLLKSLAREYRVLPTMRNMPHLEIAAIFLAHSCSYFLKPGGQLTFVMPRSLVSGDQHQMFRDGSICNVDVREIWDLQGVSPLFNVPSCVVFAQPNSGDRRTRKIGERIAGKAFHGSLANTHLHWQEATAKLSEDKSDWYYQVLGEGRKAKSALTTSKGGSRIGRNAYGSAFMQGATIVPRNLFFVEIDQSIDSRENLDERQVHVTTSADAKRNAKRRWKDCELSGFVDGQHLYYTGLSRSIVPHGFIDPSTVFLPLQPMTGELGEERILMDANDLFDQYSNSANWMRRAETIWNKHKTERSAAIRLTDWLNHRGKLTKQNVDPEHYLVLYTSSSTNICATVLQPSTLPLPFVAESKTYWTSFADAAEAHYLSAFLNADYVNRAIKQFQSRGLFGERDIHTAPLKVPYPRYEAEQAEHRQIAALAESLSGKVLAQSDLYINAHKSSHALGRSRTAIRDFFSDDFAKINALVREQVDAATTSRRKR